jgi:hypothetical protein
MAWRVGQTVLWLAAAFVAGVAGYFLIEFAVRLCRSRASDLRISREKLEQYDKMFDAIASDPALPESARDFLYEFDKGVMQHGAAHFIATAMFRERTDWLKPNGAEPRILKEMREICHHRPDLYEGFGKLIAAGFVATMLRWLIPARALRMVFIDLKQDPMTPAQAMTTAAQRKRHVPIAQAA